MPICPGCERKVSYQELDVHERYCERSSSDGPDTASSREQLEAKITYMEDQFEERVSELEKEFERRLVRLEQLGEAPVEPAVRK